MSERFRSIAAFKSYGQGAHAEALLEAVSPFQVLAEVKRHPDGVRPTVLAESFDVPEPAIHEALFELLKNQLVRLEPGATSADALIFP